MKHVSRNENNFPVHPDGCGFSFMQNTQTASYGKDITEMLTVLIFLTNHTKMCNLIAFTF